MRMKMSELTVYYYVKQEDAVEGVTINLKDFLNYPSLGLQDIPLWASLWHY